MSIFHNFNQVKVDYLTSFTLSYLVYGKTALSDLPVSSEYNEVWGLGQQLCILTYFKFIFHGLHMTKCYFRANINISEKTYTTSFLFTPQQVPADICYTLFKDIIITIIIILIISSIISIHIIHLLSLRSKYVTLPSSGVPGCSVTHYS